MEKELAILNGLGMSDKSKLLQSLKNLDKGFLTFSREELISFLRALENEVRDCTYDSNLKKYPTEFLRMCQNAVLKNERLELEFRILVGSLVPEDCATEAIVENGVYKKLAFRLANTRINEFMNAKSERFKSSRHSGGRRRNASTKA